MEINPKLKDAAIEVIDQFLGANCADDLYQYCADAVEGTDTCHLEVARLVSVALNEAIDGIKAA